jgi:large subunit ribosomal protein L9
MPTIEVILTEKIAKLGAEADMVKVKAGYARNFLFPQGKAIEKTAGAVHRINVLRAKRAEREARELNEAQEMARRLGKLKLSFELETGETGKAFGSVTASDIADKIRVELGGNAVVDRHWIVLPKPIKDTGKHDIEVKLHHDVTATITVNVTAKGAAEAEAAAEAAAKESGEKHKGEKGEKAAGAYKAKSKARHKEKD